jgi:hypothetical protein
MTGSVLLRVPLYPLWLKAFAALRHLCLLTLQQELSEHRSWLCSEAGPPDRLRESTLKRYFAVKGSYQEVEDDIRHQHHARKRNTCLHHFGTATWTKGGLCEDWDFLCKWGLELVSRKR